MSGVSVYFGNKNLQPFETSVELKGPCFCNHLLRYAQEGVFGLLLNSLWRQAHLSTSEALHLYLLHLNDVFTL